MAAERDELTDAHHTALLGVCSTVRGLFAAADRDEVLTRHRVGDVLRRVKRAPHTYGQRSVERIAAELGLAARRLYRYIEVAENWSEADLRIQLEKTNRFGQPLSWTHFLALTGARTAKERTALIDQCLDNAWSARELEHQLSDRAAGVHDTDALRAGDVVRVALKEGMQTASRMDGDARRFEEALGDRLTGAGEAVDEQLLTRTLESFEQLQARVESAITRLRSASAPSSIRN